MGPRWVRMVTNRGARMVVMSAEKLMKLAVMLAVTFSFADSLRFAWALRGWSPSLAPLLPQSWSLCPGEWCPCMHGARGASSAVLRGGQDE